MNAADPPINTYGERLNYWNGGQMQTHLTDDEPIDKLPLS
jgi:hypothetical protein